MTFDFDRLSNADVVDQNGDKIGRVGQIYLDDATNQPTFVTVQTGLFGSKETFVPLNSVDTNSDVITVPYTKDFVKGAPNIDADGHIDEAQQDEIYRYYNMGDQYATGTDRTVVDNQARRDGELAGAGYANTTGRTVADTDVNRDRNVADDGTMVRREEEVRVGTQRVETGRVRLRKHVVTEQRTVTVPVQREEVEVVREPVADGHVSDGRLGDDEQVVTLTEERPVVEKQVVDKERVGLRTNTVTDQQQVQTEVGREEITVENDGTRGTVGNNTVGNNTGLAGDVRGTNGRVGDDRNIVQKGVDALKGDRDGDGVKDKYEN